MPATAYSDDLLAVDFVVPSLVGTACYFLLGVVGLNQPRKRKAKRTNRLMLLLVL